MAFNDWSLNLFCWTYTLACNSCNVKMNDEHSKFIFFYRDTLHLHLTHSLNVWVLSLCLVRCANPPFYSRVITINSIQHTLCYYCYPIRRKNNKFLIGLLILITHFPHRKMIIITIISVGIFEMMITHMHTHAHRNLKQFMKTFNMRERKCKPINQFERTEFIGIKK